MQKRVTVFTRYPEPGKTKKRLIPALGAEEAAVLQREMTQHILEVVTHLGSAQSVEVEVRFEGGDEAKMERDFGEGRRYRRQGPGDLGARMQRAFVEAASEGADRVVMVGADCPEITAELLEKALERLATTDIVLGPASDGGYYLIGLRQPNPQLFANISWGSDQVLAETLFRARQLSLAVSLLQELSDVDRPDDLPVWERVKSGI